MKKYLLGILMMIPIMVSVIILIRGGYILDSNPSISESTASSVMSWISLIFAVLAVVLIMAWRSADRGKFSIILLIVSVALCVINIVIHYNEFKGYTVGAAKQEDYIESEWFDGVSLREVEDVLTNADDVVVYIGREDCQDCFEFENEITTVLERDSVELTTYYTNLDQEKSNNDEYQSFLEAYGINSVPFVIWAKNGEVQATWDDPMNNIESIEEAIQ
ncbi:thioredoxin family protein [Eubacterium oxidoreducens]|nr:thioredoxin family protein [Eubacterium oxidoreducens]